MADPDDTEFRRKLRLAPQRPASRAASFAAAGALVAFGLLCTVVAKSEAIFYSGFIIIGAGVVAAVRTVQSVPLSFGSGVRREF